MTRVVDAVANEAIDEARQPLIDWLHAVLLFVKHSVLDEDTEALRKLRDAVYLMQRGGEEIGALVRSPDLVDQATTGYAILVEIIENRDLARIEGMLAMYDNRTGAGSVS